jgi:polyhydroxyalkanoate synthesis repressor PhaR
MNRLIKKYKNRRLYDTKLSQYITLEQLKGYVVEGLPFKIEDSESGSDITNLILLQIIVEMEAGPSQFLSPLILRQIISLANHPMSDSLKSMMEQLFSSVEQSLKSTGYQDASEAWNKKMQEMMQYWQGQFK